MEISQVILQYTLTTVLVILAGFFIGGGLGILFALLFRLVYKATPGLRPPFTLIPWRTLLFGSVLFFCSPMAILSIPSITQEQGAVIYPALAFILIVLSFVADEAITHWLPVAPAVRWAGLARTLTVACGVIVAIGANASGSGILMYARILTSSTFSPGAYWTALGVVIGLGLVLDVLLGTIQMLVMQAESRKTVMMTPPAEGN